MANVDPGDVHPGLSKYSEFAAQASRKVYEAAPLLWASGTTFRQACDLSVLFVMGIIPISPYHLGPMDAESGPFTDKFAQMTRNGLLTTISEPVGSDTEILNGTTYHISRASVGFWIRLHNEKHIENMLDKLGDGVKVEIMEVKFGQEFGKSYRSEDDLTINYFIEGDEELGNGLFDALLEASYNFTQFPEE